jgi:hypothetical protein
MKENNDITPLVCMVLLTGLMYLNFFLVGGM